MNEKMNTKHLYTSRWTVLWTKMGLWIKMIYLLQMLLLLLNIHMIELCFSKLLLWYFSPVEASFFVGKKKGNLWRLGTLKQKFHLILRNRTKNISQNDGKENILTQCLFVSFCFFRFQSTEMLIIITITRFIYCMLIKVSFSVTAGTIKISFVAYNK